MKMFWFYREFQMNLINILLLTVLFSKFDGTYADDDCSE